MGTRTERKEDFVGGFGFGVVEHSHKDVMVLPNHHQSYTSPSSSSFCYCSSGVGDPMFSASNNQAYTPSPSEMFCLAGSASASAPSVADPFFTLSSSSGEMGRCMSDKAGSGFSEAQWQELERQRNIYKYMMASVPVPSELLTPFSKNQSNTNPDVTVAKGGSLKLGIASNAADIEPWRCKRTDGKKWRCSRNVIPDQKYCERHTHKSRPRSRKHVESSQSSHHNDNRTAKNDANQFARSYPQFYGQPESQFSLVSTLPPASSSYDHHHHRGLRWFMKEDDPITTLSPEVQLKVGTSREIKRGFEYDLNFREKEPLVDRSFGALQSLLSLNQTPPQHTQETRRFVVDQGEQDEAMGISLSLSMAGGSMEEAECTNQHQWVSQEGPSWLCSTTPGGPLAEALCLGVSNNNPSTSTTTSSCSRS